MRVVLDTNVLLSAMLSPRGIPHTIYCAWREARFELVTSEHQLDELRRASRYPKFKSVLQPAKIGTMINHMQHALIIEPTSIDLDIPDPNDAFLLGISAAGRADFLVTGDHRAGLIQMKRFSSCRILTPSLFCAEVL